MPNTKLCVAQSDLVLFFMSTFHSFTTANTVWYQSIVLYGLEKESIVSEIKHTAVMILYVLAPNKWYFLGQEVKNAKHNIPAMYLQ